jgi:DNA polymerase
MALGEAPGEQETYRGQTFVGQSGQELDRMLNEAGIMTSQCYYTHVLKYQPFRAWNVIFEVR